MSNKDTVAAIYEAFGRSDIQFIVDQMADDVAWESWEGNTTQSAGLPYMRHLNNKNDLPSFFGEVAKLDLRKFDVLSIMEGGNQVAAEIEIEFTALRDEEMHLWTFNDEGKVIRFRRYLDTAKHIEAHRHLASASA